MHLSGPTALCLAAVIAAGCGGDGGYGGDRSTTTAPAPGAVTAADLTYCFEGAGVSVERPGEAREAGDAKQALLVSWTGGHAADVYLAPSDAAAEEAAAELRGDDGKEVTQKSNVVLVSDEKLTPDEALLASDCIP